MIGQKTQALFYVHPAHLVLFVEGKNAHFPYYATTSELCDRAQNSSLTAPEPLWKTCIITQTKHIDGPTSLGFGAIFGAWKMSFCSSLGAATPTFWSSFGAEKLDFLEHLKQYSSNL